MSNMDELLASGKRAAYKNQCKSVIVAPDHTGVDNYHNCDGSPGHGGDHESNMYRWDAEGTVTFARLGGLTFVQSAMRRLVHVSNRSDGDIPFDSVARREGESLLDAARRWIDSQPLGAQPASSM